MDNSPRKRKKESTPTPQGGATPLSRRPIKKDVNVLLRSELHCESVESASFFTSFTGHLPFQIEIV